MIGDRIGCKSMDKCCKKCGVVKPEEDFPVYRAGNFEGRRGECRNCLRARQAAWARNDRRKKPEYYVGVESRRAAKQILKTGGF